MNGATMSSSGIQETSNPSRAAKQVGIPVSTLRLWCKVYAEFLSAGANPPSGEERRFTGADLETLKAVAQLRGNGMQPADIILRLRNNPAAGLQDGPGQGATALQVHEPTDPSHDAIQRFLQGAEVRDKLTDIDRRLERVEQRNTTLLIAFAAFAAGAVVVAVVVWLLSMLR